MPYKVKKTLANSKNLNHKTKAKRIITGNEQILKISAKPNKKNPAL